MTEQEKRKYQRLGKELARVRKSHGDTQTDVAELLGFKGHPMITAFENGEKKPSLDQLAKIAAHYNYPVSHFIDIMDGVKARSNANKEHDLEEKIIELLQLLIEEKRKNR